MKALKTFVRHGKTYMQGQEIALAEIPEAHRQILVKQGYIEIPAEPVKRGRKPKGETK